MSQYALFIFLCTNKNSGLKGRKRIFFIQRTDTLKKWTSNLSTLKTPMAGGRDVPTEKSTQIEMPKIINKIKTWMTMN
jgi:hypothetical protein